MNVWLDDERPMPSGFDTTVKTAQDAISLIAHGNVKLISLDHDLGPMEAGTGYDVAKYIEKMAFQGVLSPLKWAIHSANPIGRKNIESALKNADRYWETKTETFKQWLESTSSERKGAGILFTDGKSVLILRRKYPSDHAGTWGLPGGGTKGNETPLATATRETNEECGIKFGTQIRGKNFAQIKEENFVVFFFLIKEQFKCRLSKEHSDYKWVPFKDLTRENLHPKFKQHLTEYLTKIKFHLS